MVFFFPLTIFLVSARQLEAAGACTNHVMYTHPQEQSELQAQRLIVWSQPDSRKER